MLGFLEPVCRQVCSQSYYNWLGQYFWPELLSGSSILEFFTELDTTGVIATGTVLLASAGGIYYYISHRSGQVHVEASTTPIAQTTPTISMEQAQQLLEQQREEAAARLQEKQRLEAEQVQRLQEAQLALEAESVATIRNANRREFPAIDFSGHSQPITSIARKPMDRDIVREYLKTHTSERVRYGIPYEKSKVEQEVFTAFGLPADGLIPTDPAQLEIYHSKLRNIGKM